MLLKVTAAPVTSISAPSIVRALTPAPTVRSVASKSPSKSISVELAVRVTVLSTTVAPLTVMVPPSVMVKASTSMPAALMSPVPASRVSRKSPVASPPRVMFPAPAPVSMVVAAAMVITPVPKSRLLLVLPMVPATTVATSVVTSKPPANKALPPA